MEAKTLLDTLSPQLRGIVEASLGSKLPSSTAFEPKHFSKKDVESVREPVGQNAQEASHQTARLDPTELFSTVCSRKLCGSLQR